MTVQFSGKQQTERNSALSSPSSGAGGHPWSAFTLLELLVSLAVLAMLIVLAGQMLSGATTTIGNSGKFLDSDKEARMIFAQMSNDFAAMYNRADINFYFHSQPGNDEFYFYSQASGHIASQDPAGTTDASINSASLIGYRVSDRVSNGTRAELERLGLGLHWADSAGGGPFTSVQFLPMLISDGFKAAIADPYNNSSNAKSGSAPTDVPEWDVIGPQVFRMEFCFLLTSGSFSSLPYCTAGMKDNATATNAPKFSDDSNAGYSTGSRWYDTSSQVAYRCTNAAPNAAEWTPLGLQDVKGIVVAIAILDSKKRQLGSITAIRNAIPQLADFDSANPVPMAGLWIQKTANIGQFTAATDLNSAAVASLRVYERIFYLN